MAPLLKRELIRTFFCGGGGENGSLFQDGVKTGLLGELMKNGSPTNFGALGMGGVKNCRSGPKFFCVFWVPQSHIGLISAEIGALCRIARRTGAL